MSIKVDENGLGAVVKECIDNFEYNPDKKCRGKNSLINHMDECAFINDDKSKMFLVNEYKDGLVYTNHIIDSPLGSLVEFRDAKDLKGVLCGVEDGKSIITMLGYEAELYIGKPFWVTDKILLTPNDGKKYGRGESPYHKVVEVSAYNQDGTTVSFGEQQIPTFNNGIDVIVNDIMTEAEKDRMYFICTSCNCVGDTDYLNKNILKATIQMTSGIVCKECYEGKESDGIRPTEDEMIIASFSEFNFISKFDQTVEQIVEKDESQPHGVKLGTILSFDDVNVKESSTKITGELKELMQNIKEGLKGKLGSKVNDNKLNRMINKPNQTMLLIELAEIKRKLKLAKRTNHKQDIEYFQNIFTKTKEQLDITHD